MEPIPTRTLEQTSKHDDAKMIKSNCAPIEKQSCGTGTPFRGEKKNL